MYLYQQACEFLNNETAALEKELKKKDEYLNELYAENRKLKELVSDLFVTMIRFTFR